MSRIYLAGPMTGLPDLHRPAFTAAAAALAAAGHQPVNPHDLAPHRHEGNCPPAYAVNNGHSAACYLRTCLAVLLTCDEVQLLAGWADSIGATREHSLARWTGIPVRDHEEVYA